MASAADQALQYNDGGQFNAAIASLTTETLVYTGQGRLCRLNICAAGTASVSIYDGTQSTGGTLIFTSLANDALGVTKVINFPIATGILVKGTTGCPGIAVSYNKSGVGGNA